MNHDITCELSLISGTVIYGRSGEFEVVECYYENMWNAKQIVVECR